VDFRDYDWANPSYETPFLRERVIEDFMMQIQKYKNESSVCSWRRVCGEAVPRQVPQRIDLFV